jgi:phytoene dehydrogenase-like protein
MRVAVIGSGLGGLSAACTLAARGYQVEVFEKNPWLGGKAAVLEEQGFRFDMGPTILIQPSVLRRIFCEAGRNMNDYLDMVRLDPQWRCFFDDGTVLDLKDDLRQNQGWARALLRSWSSPKDCTPSLTSFSFGSRWARCAIPSISAAASSSRCSRMF